jgi:hypothetical protein
MLKKIYLSGKITGLNHEVALQKFKDAEISAKKHGIEVVNPMTLNHNHDKSWEAYMLEDIKYLFECDGIYMLENWTDSKGARIEHNIAKEMDLKIIYEFTCL